MSDLLAQQRILNESKARVKALKFGEPVTNICAGEKNPHRHCLFVQYVVKSRKNRWYVTHREYWAKCTDGKGEFWNTDIEVIYPGHLSVEESDKLFEPVWQAKFGKVPGE